MKKGVLLLILVILITSCKPDNNQIPNPASKYCIEQGHELEMRTDENGQYGVCIFEDGSECEEWAYFRKECEPGLGDELICETDSDCVPASCCHANSCVNVENKADCSSMKCTLSCEPGTLDCQQGKCVCENDRCTVKIG